MFESSPGAALERVTLLQLIVTDLWDAATLSLAEADLTKSDQAGFKGLSAAVGSVSLLRASRTEHPAFTGRTRQHIELD